MKKIFQILLFFLFSISVLSQERTDSVPKNEKNWDKKILVSCGLNLTDYYTDAFYRNMFENTENTPIYFNSSAYVIDGSSIPEKLNYNSTILHPSFSIGIELRSGILNHILETGFASVSSNYSYNNSYREVDGQLNSYTVDDTSQIHYSQTIFSFGYKCQPTFRFLFLSLGIDLCINKLKIEENKKVKIDAIDYFGNNISYISKNTESDTTYHLHFTNGPFQIGFGGNIKIKTAILKPGFYFTPTFLKGYDLYNVYSASVAVLFGRKKHK